jgi:hypothetical protein
MTEDLGESPSEDDARGGPSVVVVLSVLTALRLMGLVGLRLGAVIVLIIARVLIGNPSQLIIKRRPR